MAAVRGALTGYGWPVLTGSFTGPYPRLRKFAIPGTHRTVNLRDGVTGFLLVHFACRWDRQIHQIDMPGETPDEWGWASRPVRGQTFIISEHAGGKALDLDATLHPRGVPVLRTFKPVQVAKVHYLLRKYDGALGWGGDYRRTPDGMHVEIAWGVPIGHVQKVAMGLINSPIGIEIIKANPGLRKVILS